MQLPRSTDRARLLLHGLMPFVLTLAIGALVFGVVSRRPSGRVTANPSVTSRKLVKDSPGNDDALEVVKLGNAETGDDLYKQDSRTKVVADHQAIGVQSIVINSSPSDSQVVMPPVGWASVFEAAMYQNRFSSGTPSIFSANVPVPSGQNQNGISNSSTTAASASDYSTSEYPPRRIPWHQGFSVEQEWYRSWYGWAASY